MSSEPKNGAGNEEALSGVICDYLHALEAGRQPDRTALLAAHPGLAGDLAEFFAAHDQLGDAAAPLRHAVRAAVSGAPSNAGLGGPDARVALAGPPAAAGQAAQLAGALAELGQLGDFRLVREVGRGGMGIVYEAVQISLNRRVALKVLPFAGALDPKQLQRFKNESQAAAHLQHQHIVPVYFVGCERGVHFYAMQYIDGQTLAQLIAELRRSAGEERAPTPRDELLPATAETAAAPLPPADAQPTTGYSPTRLMPAPPTPDTVPQAGLATERSHRTATYFRTVGRLGEQAAEALHHAHEMGVVHRDVNPGNLLLDGRGNVWVTDFGLARMQTEASLTLSGDLVGTVRYMSPEQALANRVIIDHRPDVYSLGATLYELLVLRPAFAGNDRQELLRRIAFDEPVPPRRLNKAVPAELETVVLKALEKRPEDRYATAIDLADDLQRFLRDEPVRAKRPSLVQRVRRWMRRHQALVGGAAAALLAALLVLAAGLGWVLRDQAARKAVARAEAEAALKDITRLREAGRWKEAAALARRAERLLVGGGGGNALRRQMRDLAADLEMLDRLEGIRLGMTAVKDDHFDGKGASRAYTKAFRDFGIDVFALEPAEAGRLVRGRALSVELAAALDGWAGIRAGAARHRLFAIARAADPDPDRDRLRRALEREDRKALAELASAKSANRLPAPMLISIAMVLNRMGDRARAVSLLVSAHRNHPGDFWINNQLAFYLQMSQPPRLEEAIRYYTAALALRPHSPGAQLNLGVALQRKGNLQEAVRCFEKAIELKKDYAMAHNNLGNVLCDMGRPDEAIAEYQETIRLNPDYAPAHNNLGTALSDKGLRDQAMVEYHQAIRLKKDYAEPHFNLGLALSAKGRLAEGAAEYRKAIRLKKDYAGALINLGIVLGQQGLWDQAIAEYR
jgi:serine/threonine protein kinase/Tfp pilus assembly protein PilF